LIIFIKDTGPDATPEVEATISPSSRRSEYLIPTPPPDLKI